jgi:lipopolysaccharide/colanic/teichoic acid biosynthesis glycosyltransferase
VLNVFDPAMIDLRRAAQASPAHRRQWRWYVKCKAAVEAAVTLMLMIPAASLVLVCAAGIKLTSPGPVFYSQVRLGRGGRPYRMHKLRTMPHDCEATTGPVWSTPDDPRVTRFGRFLRDTHLDEVPQLWNVLCGEMSLIGPRPERPEIVEHLERALPRYRERLLVRPGLTGLAQTQLSADSDVKGVRRKLAYDLHYVHHLSPWLDLRIGVSTLFYLVGVVSNSIGRELIKSDRRAAEHRMQSIEFHDDQPCEIGTQ